MGARAFSCIRSGYHVAGVRGSFRCICFPHGAVLQNGLRGIDSNLATAVRVSFILILVWGIVIFTGKVGEVRSIQPRTMLFLFLSAIATGLSWLFYFKALQLGDVCRVAPIDKLSVPLTMVLGVVILGEAVSWKLVIGGLLITAGTLVLIL